MKYCRICFKQSSDKEDRMLPLSLFIPLIKLIAKTNLLQHGENSICKSCANILVMANLFRIKIIESNDVYRELMEFKQSEKKNGWSFSDGFEPETFTIQPVVQEKKDRVADPSENIPIQTKNGTKTNMENLQNICNKNLNTNSNLLKSENLVIFGRNQECTICGKNESKEHADLMVIKKILHSLNNKNDIKVCLGCKNNLKRIEIFVKQHFTVKNCEKEICCQFCLKTNLRLKEMPKYMFYMYNALPDVKKKIAEDTKYHKKTCNECIKALQIIYEIQNTHYKKTRDDRRRIAQFPPLLQNNLSKRTYKSQKKLKLRSKQNFVKPASDEELPEDFQCHMSDFEEEDSDTELPPVKFGHPLNVPFTPKYLECTECRTECITSLEMEVHVEIMHRTFSDVCNLCNKKFPSISCVQNHKLNVHFMNCSFSVNGRNSKKSLCDICGIRTREFKSHYGIHIGAKNEFKCDFCDHTSRVKNRLRLHIMAIHTKVKKYKCSYCGKGFSYSSDRIRHEISSHTKQYKYICKVCNKGFTKKNFLTAHQKTHDIILSDT